MQFMAVAVLCAIRMSHAAEAEGFSDSKSTKGHGSDNILDDVFSYEMEIYDEGKTDVDSSWTNHVDHSSNDKYFDDVQRFYGKLDSLLELRKSRKASEVKSSKQKGSPMKLEFSSYAPSDD